MIRLGIFLLVWFIFTSMAQSQDIKVDLSGKYDFGLNNFTTDFILSSNGKLITKVDYLKENDEKKYGLQIYDSKYLMIDEKEIENSSSGKIHEILSINNKILITTYSGCINGRHDYNVIKLNSNLQIEKVYNALQFQDVLSKEDVKMQTLINKDENMVCFVAHQKSNKSLKIKAVVQDYNFNKLWVNEFEFLRKSGKYEVEVDYSFKKNGELYAVISEYNSTENFYSVFQADIHSNFQSIEEYKDIECLSLHEINGAMIIFAGVKKEGNKRVLFMQSAEKFISAELPEKMNTDIQSSIEKHKFKIKNYLKIKNIENTYERPNITLELNGVTQLADDKTYFNQYQLGNLYQVNFSNELNTIEKYSIIYRNQSSLTDLITGTLMFQNESGSVFLFNDCPHAISNEPCTAISNTDDSSPYLLFINNENKVVKRPLLDKEFKDYDLVPKSCKIMGNKIYFVVVKTNLKGIKDQRIGAISIDSPKN